MRENPDIAAKELLMYDDEPIKLNWYQRKFLRDFWTKQFGLMIWSRAAGKSFFLAVFCILRALLYRNHKVLIVAGSYRQSQNVFRLIEKIWNESPLFQQAALKPPSRTPLRCELLFRHGSSIVALPLGDGNKIRGERAQTLVVDEALVVPPDIIDTVLMPMLNVGSNPWAKQDITKNSILLATTAYYQFNHVYERYRLFLEATNPFSEKYDPNYCLSVINVLDVPKEWLDVNIVKSQRYTMTRTKWLMENMSMFPSDSEGYYSAAVVEKCKRRDLKIELEGDPDAQYVMGIDPARHGANFAVAIVKIGEPCEYVYAKTLHRRPGQEQEDLIRKLCRKFNIVWIVMDRGGGGLHLKDLLAQPKKFYDVERDRWIEDPPIIDVNDDDLKFVEGRRMLNVKQCQDKDNTEMNEYLKAAFENERLVIPAFDDYNSSAAEEVRFEIEETINELLDIKATPLNSGFYRFETSSRNKKKDRYSALLLAMYGVKEYTASVTRNENTGYDGFHGFVVEGLPWYGAAPMRFWGV